VLRTARAEIRAAKYIPDYNQTYYGCLRKTRRPFALFDVSTSSGGSDGVSLSRLAGVYAAFDIRTVAYGGHLCYSTIAVYDLRRGRKIHDAPATSAAASGPPAADPCYADAAALLLTGSGGAAWVTAPNPDGLSQVRKVDRAGGATLDSGDIAMGSLTLNGAIVSWTKAGQRQSPTLK